MSTDPRLFVDAPLAAGATLPLAPAQAHYLGTVLRRAPGSALHLFNGRDGEWLARLASLKRDRADAVVERQTRPQQGDTDLWLAFALLKRDATDLVVQKATELGAAVLLPVITARTNAHRVNEDRLRAIAIEAAEQCERLTLPELRPPQTLAAVLADWPADRPLFAALERSPAAAPLRPHARAGLLVGPEGGFAPAELDALRSHPIVTPVQIGPRVLRAETACLAGLALLQAPGCG
ncbi:MAG: 16S rRNA (uracil(1498)-N(3))-methyltransferase [Rhodospirillales bacterium]|nr:16S rRNA (uracil(1498)-N(3))-methyltransferase [Rhodospirillales bacterium]